MNVATNHHWADDRRPRIPEGGDGTEETCAAREGVVEDEHPLTGDVSGHCEAVGAELALGAAARRPQGRAMLVPQRPDPLDDRRHCRPRRRRDEHHLVEAAYAVTAIVNEHRSQGGQPQAHAGANLWAAVVLVATEVAMEETPVHRHGDRQDLDRPHAPVRFEARIALAIVAIARAVAVAADARLPDRGNWEEARPQREEHLGGGGHGVPLDEHVGLRVELGLDGPQDLLDVVDGHHAWGP
jgi:hypothetical protein